MIEIKSENKDIILRFSKDLISNTFLETLIERLEMEILANKNQMTDEQVLELSDEIKKDWWNKQGTELLERITAK